MPIILSPAFKSDLNAVSNRGGCQRSESGEANDREEGRNGVHARLDKQQLREQMCFCSGAPKY